MEGRPSRGRGGSGKRGGRGGNDSDSHSGEHRGRGRGGHYRGRGKRDHYRGRGRGASGHAADFHRRDQDQEEADFQDDDVTVSFSRRKLQSNWDRYEASEKQAADDETPTQRGTDYHVLLQSAGDSFTQFRFSDEKDWEMDSFVASQMSALVDLPALAQSLQQVPLHQRLNLEAELIQVSIPVELPTQLTLKPELSKTTAFSPPSTTAKASSALQTVAVPPKPLLAISPKAAESPGDDIDEELDQLLSLQKPVSALGNQFQDTLDEEQCESEKVCEEVKEDVPEVSEEKTDEVKDKHVTQAPAKKELTEDDLEDWLDSMIS